MKSVRTRLGLRLLGIQDHQAAKTKTRTAALLKEIALLREENEKLRDEVVFATMAWKWRWNVPRVDVVGNQDAAKKRQETVTKCIENAYRTLRD